MKASCRPDAAHQPRFTMSSKQNALENAISDAAAHGFLAHTCVSVIVIHARAALCMLTFRCCRLMLLQKQKPQSWNNNAISIRAHFKHGDEGMKSQTSDVRLAKRMRRRFTAARISRIFVNLRHAPPHSGAHSSDCRLHNTHDPRRLRQGACGLPQKHPRGVKAHRSVREHSKTILHSGAVAVQIPVEQEPMRSQACKSNGLRPQRLARIAARLHRHRISQMPRKAAVRKKARIIQSNFQSFHVYQQTAP